jgi:hypothetical protein
VALALGLCGTAAAMQDRASGEALSLPSRIELKAHQALIEVIAASHHQPSAFVTDGCSGGLSLAWKSIAHLFPGFADLHQTAPPWEGCCVTHDRAYHVAGEATTAENSYHQRLAADTALQQCVIEIGKQRTPALVEQYPLSAADVAQVYRYIAQSMFDAVRLGGGPCSGLPWRWGYGYANCW